MGILPVTPGSLVLWIKRWVEVRLHAVETTSTYFDTGQLQVPVYEVSSIIPSDES